MEQQLALLWERVKKGDQQQEQRHGDVLGLYSTLREQLHTQTDRESLGLWVSSLLEQRLGVLRTELEQETTNRAQVRREESMRGLNRNDYTCACISLVFFSLRSLQGEEHQKQHQESHALRLADLELLLKALAAKTEVCLADSLLPLREHNIKAHKMHGDGLCLLNFYELFVSLQETRKVCDVKYHSVIEYYKPKKKTVYQIKKCSCQDLLIRNIFKPAVYTCLSKTCFEEKNYHLHLENKLFFDQKK